MGVFRMMIRHNLSDAELRGADSDGAPPVKIVYISNFAKNFLHPYHRPRIFLDPDSPLEKSIDNLGNKKGH